MRQLARALTICEKVGALKAANETGGPTTKIAFLGIELDTEDIMAQAHIREPA
jgi:hypothetical protein